MTVTPRRRSAADVAPVAIWHKSSRSIPDEACVEVNRTDAGILVRDSKDPDGPRLFIRRPAWTGFINGIPAWPGSGR